MIMMSKSVQYSQMCSWHLYKYCFSFSPNVSTDCAWSRKSVDKLLQILAPATTKFRVPSLVFVAVTARRLDTAERRCRRLAIDS